MVGRIAREIRNNLVAGLLVFVPIAFTAWLIIVMGNWVDRPVRSLFSTPLPDQTGTAAAIARVLHSVFGSGVAFLDQPGLGLLLLILVIFILGMFARTVLGKWAVKVGERIVRYVPVVRTIYGGVKQLLEAVMVGQQTGERNVVLVEFPHEGVYGVGFATGSGSEEIRERTGTELVSIFYPTTPNPTSGFMLLVPRKDVIFLDMNVEDAAKMIISGGMAVPPGKGEAVKVENVSEKEVAMMTGEKSDGDSKGEPDGK